MTDPRVARLKTAEDCETIATNARALGRPDLADAARRRAVELRAEAHGATTDVERECLQAVYAYQEVRRRPATRTWQMIKRLGILPAVERIVTKRKESLGYISLVKIGLKDMAFEAVVLRHPDKFSEDAITRSRERLG